MTWSLVNTQIVAATRMASVAMRLGVEVGVGDQRARGGQRVRAARADADQAVVGLDDVAGSGDDERVLAIGHRQERLEPAQHAIGAPVLGELDRGARQVAAVLFQLGLESREERERVGGRSREPGHDPIAVELSHLAGAGLDDGVADGDLTVTGDRHLAAMSYRDHGRRSNCL